MCTIVKVYRREVVVRHPDLYLDTLANPSQLSLLFSSRNSRDLFSTTPYPETVKSSSDLKSTMTVKMKTSEALSMT